MSTVEAPKFEGIYVAPEAAVYLTATLKRDIPDRPLSSAFTSRRLIRWIRAGLVAPDLIEVPGNDLLITFQDLVSMRVIALMRALGLSWTKIHRAEHWLREQTGHHRPFAVQRVWSETRDVFADLPFGLAVASRAGQLAFSELIGGLLEPVDDMTFGRVNGYRVADTWTPHLNVTIDPEVQFGEPCVTDTRTPTRMLWRMFNGGQGDSLAYLSRAFQLTEEQIGHALEWEDRLVAVQSPSISR